AICQHFKDERLRQLFGRYATYCGSSPFAAPATLMLVAHVEQAGVWTLPGGTAALAALIADEIRARGGELHTGTHVEEILVKGDRAAGVVADGREFPADIVVFNGDAAALNAGLLGKAVSRTGARIGPKERSLSAVTFCARLKGDTPLGYHTVAFGRDYRAEFDALFKARRMPDDPTIYVCAPEPPSNGSGESEGEGGQGALIIMNAPADGDERPYTEEDIAQCQTQAMETLRRCGLAASLSEVTATTPADFSQKLPGTGGAIYGRSSHGWTASFQRPALKSRVKGLYLAGGSVHPGPGAPMSALSGMMAGEMILKDFGLAPKSRREDMPGGTPTGSRRTAHTR
ncbi:MAG: FAD-dependent oxidoreductase, partial [Pseudomonadota bacterium]